MLPKIYAFMNNKTGGEGVAYAMAEDGAVLGSHMCSSEGWVSNDLGVHAGSRPDRHEDYAKHYPEGYEMEFVQARAVPGHAGLQEAFRLNSLLAEAASKERAAEVENSGLSVEC
jgi:hypothetical protein